MPCVFSVKLSPIGSNPFSIITVLPFNQPENAKTSDSSQSDRDKSKIKSDREDMNLASEGVQASSQSSVLNKQTKPPSESKESVASEESSQEFVTEQIADENIGRSASSTDEGLKKKPKPSREDYEKISITSKGDYKIRKKLDAAEKLLGEVIIDLLKAKGDKYMQHFLRQI